MATVPSTTCLTGHVVFLERGPCPGVRASPRWGSGSRVHHRQLDDGHAHRPVEYLRNCRVPEMTRWTLLTADVDGPSQIDANSEVETFGNHTESQDLHIQYPKFLVYRPHLTGYDRFDRCGSLGLVRSDRQHAPQAIIIRFWARLAAADTARGRLPPTPLGGRGVVRWGRRRACPRSERCVAAVRLVSGWSATTLRLDITARAAPRIVIFARRPGAGSGVCD